MPRAAARDSIYYRRRYTPEVIELRVRWYVTYRLSYRDISAMMAERDIAVIHTTILRCMQRYVPGSSGAGHDFQSPSIPLGGWDGNLRSRSRAMELPLSSGRSSRKVCAFVPIRGPNHRLCAEVLPPDTSGADELAEHPEIKAALEGFRARRFASRARVTEEQLTAGRGN
ncbi:MAG TPA: hypothetical protein VFN79_10950 [Steroidobacteraceae bacterium]|nr:hypothetical protein [Steroidobacteraceae bacterium]